MFTRLLLATKGLRYFADRVTFGKNRKAVLRDFKDFLKNDVVLVVANGPSLNVTPLHQFDGVTSLGMNKIDLIYKKTKWRADFVFCNNNLVAKQHWRDWLDGGASVMLSWKCRWFIPFWRWKEFRFYLSDTDTDCSDNFSERVASAGTVSYAALQFALYSGASTIIIVGLDHNFAGVSRSDAHKIERRVGSDPNHFDPNYFAHGQLWGVPNLELSEIGFTNIRNRAEARGVKVFDATIGGKLEIFEKISIDQALDIVKSERN